MAVLTSPATAAVAVAIAGMIFPAMRLVFSLSAGSIEYILARREDADVIKSMWPLLSSSFSNWRGHICNPSAGVHVTGCVLVYWCTVQSTPNKVDVQNINSSVMHLITSVFR